MIALRSHKQIANCPVRMQKLIARYGVLETYDPNRCIVKQGHEAQAFYYIFYGTGNCLPFLSIKIFIFAVNQGIIDLNRNAN